MILDVNNVDVFIVRYMIECSNMNCDGIGIIVVSVYIYYELKFSSLDIKEVMFGSKC